MEDDQHKLFQDLQEADQRYKDFVERFMARMWNEVNHAEHETLKLLRDDMDKTMKDLERLIAATRNTKK